MAITTVDTLLGAMTTGTWRSYTKKSGTAQALTGTYLTLWNAAGSPAPGSLAIGDVVNGIVPTSSTLGAIPFTNPAGLSYLSNVMYQSGQLSAIMNANVLICDRVWHAGTFSATGSGTIAGWTGGTALTRPDSTGTDVEAWIEVVAVNSTTASTITFTYTDQAGNTNQTATAVFPASAVAGQMAQFLLGSGSGVRSIQAISNGTALASGSFNIVLVRRLAEIGNAISTAPNPLQDIDPFSSGLPIIPDNACLFGIMESSAGTATTLTMRILIAQG